MSRRPQPRIARSRRHGSRQQPHRPHGCWDHLLLAPLWLAYQANLGTLLRTCDAVGACMAIPRTPHYRQSLEQGDTLKRRPHLHWVKGDRIEWIASQQQRGLRILAVEVVEDATPLPLLTAARAPTLVLLGHEGVGVPEEAWHLVDEFVRIPMVGSGRSLNVAVAGSLVAYRLAGLG